MNAAFGGVDLPPSRLQLAAKLLDLFSAPA
jgi:hypothetical protein